MLLLLLKLSFLLCWATKVLLWLGEGRRKGIPGRGRWVMRENYICLVWGWSGWELCSLRRGCYGRQKVPESLTVWLQQWGWLHLEMMKAQPWGVPLETVLIRLFWLRRLLQATLRTEEFSERVSDTLRPEASLWAVWSLKLAIWSVSLSLETGSHSPPIIRREPPQGLHTVMSSAEMPRPQSTSRLLSGHLLRVSSQGRPSSCIANRLREGKRAEGISVSDSSLIRCLLRSWPTRLDVNLLIFKKMGSV